MTKLVLVLAVVVVVILVVVIVAVRNMRTEDPDEFADQGDGRGRAGGNQDDRDLGSPRRESAGRQPARAGRGARAAGGPASGHSAAGRQGNGPRPAGASRGYRRAQDAEDGRGYDADDGFDQRGGQPSDDRRSAPVASGPQKRRRPEGGMQHRPESPAPARTRRRSGDSSEWDSSEWEQLSDVDYWTELASSKPMTAGAQPAKRGGAAAGPGQDLEPETLAVRAPAPGGVPRRDPVTGLPVREPQPADAELAAAAGRTDFAAAPVPVAGTQERQRPPAASNGDRGSRHHRRPPGGQNGDRGQTGRQLPPAAPVSNPGQRFLDAPGRDPGSYLDVGPASMPMPAIRDVPLAPPARQGRPRDIPAAPPAAAIPPAAQAPPARRKPLPAPLDDDPLTSPSFPKVPASDSRSYRNGRVDTPPGGSRAPGPYPAATPQLPSYDPPTAQYPGAQYSAAQYPTAQYPTVQYPEVQYPEAQYPTAQYPTVQPSAPPRSGQHSAPHGSAPETPAPQRRAPGRPAAQHSAPQYPGDASRGTPSGYRPDPLPSRNPYPAPVANGSPGPATTPPGRAPAAPAAAGNPYGSYVTPDSGQAPASGYNSYPATPGNGHGQPYLPPAVPGGTGQNGNGYWHQSAPDSGSRPAPGGSSYPEAAAQASEPRHADLQGPSYRNGYGQHGQADYPPNGYPADPANPAGYAPVDPYGSDGYGGYPEYGAAER